jgi:hypothetical protein
MPCSRKYDDFKEGSVIVQKGKNPPYEVASYIPITCPHCNVVFTEIKEGDIKTTKASKCLKHIRLCPEFKGEVPPKRSTVTRPSAVVSDSDLEVKVARGWDEREELRSALRKKEDENKELREEIEAMDKRDALQKEMIAELRETCAYWRKLYESQKETIELEVKLRELRCGLK